MRYSFVLTALTAGAAARIVTVNAVYTPPAVTVYETRTPEPTTIRGTVTEATTIFEAVTIPTTLATGTIITTSVSTKSAPVQQTDSYSTTSLSNTINPETYTNGYTVVSASTSSLYSSTGGLSVPSSTGSSAVQSATTSPESLPTSVAVTSEATSLGTSLTTSLSSETSSITTSSGTSETQSGPSSSILSSSTSSTSPGQSSGSSSTSSASSVGYYTAGGIFDPVATTEPPTMFSREKIPFDMPDGVDLDNPVQTNKFYANAFLEGQNLTMFAQPYGLFWSTENDLYGLGVSYTNSSQRVFGSDDSTGAAEYYTNPLMLGSFILSAAEFEASTMSFGVSNMGPFSVDVTLTSGDANLSLPIVLGMGMVSGLYSDGTTPQLFSQLGVQQLVASPSPHGDVLKYTATLFNSEKWNIYVSGAPTNFKLNVDSDYNIVGSTTSTGSLVLQVGVIPPSGDSYLDMAAGLHVTGAVLGGETSDGSTATYRIKYSTSGSSSSGSPLVYALPHHVSSFSSSTQQAVTNGTLYSPTKNSLTGVLSDTLEMTESLNTDLQWLVPNKEGTSVSADALKVIASTVNDEIAEDMIGQTNTTSTYTAGKSFDKFAYILLVASEILDNDNVTLDGLTRLQEALEPWLINEQPTPFIYDTLCKGVTSSAANAVGGSPLDDYGAPFYNDHHFHYGYYVHAAAVIAYLDEKVGNGTWLQKAEPFVTSLIRDVANPSSEDPYFPVSRMFDWYSGHSWAAGLFVSGDGKNEESTSEDYNFAYGMKLWGKVTGDKEMEARGDLMLAIMRRSMDMYFYYQSDNEVQPSNYIANRVAGITFENKLDHTTYFGTNIEYIQGIHMIPLTGASVLTRQQAFVEQEWNSLLETVVTTLDSGWLGILRANQALYDPEESYQFFAQSDFSSEWLDGGASRSWYLAYAALLGGSSS